MEPQTLLIGVAGFVLSFLAIYLISVFSMREKTFEEVLEEQRKRHEEEERKAKSERRAEKGERKKYRKFKEKPKDKSSPSPPRETQPAAESDIKAVVPPVVPVVVEETVAPTAAAPTESSIKAKSPKSSKKAHKSVAGDSNTLGDSSGNSIGKNDKPLVGARSSVSPVRKEEVVVVKNVQQVAAAPPHEAENVDKESKTGRKTSPSKQTSLPPPVSASAPAKQQKQEQPEQQQKKQKQKQKQQEQQQQPPKNVQAAPQGTKPQVEEPKANNTKTSKAAKQDANIALEKQIIIVTQNQKPASSSEENTTKKLSKKEKKAAAAAAAAVTTTPATITPEKDVVVATEEKSVKDQAPKEKRAKKGKSENGTSGVTQLISSVKGTALNDLEIQTLLDVLQSKQTKKPQQDDSVSLRKQLEEKEKKIIEVTACEAKAQQAVTELKQKILSAEKQSENKIKKLMNDNKALLSQVKKTESDYEENLATLTDRMKQMESNTVGKDVYQKIVDEVSKLKSAPVGPVIDPAEMASMKQKVQIMEKELNNNVLKLNNSEKNRKKFEEKVKTFESKAQNENHKLEELSVALKKATNEKAVLTDQNKQASEALKAVQLECATLKSQLEDRELNNKDAERNLLNLSKKVEELKEELVIVKEKNQVLLEENKLVREKPVAVEENLGERQEPAGAPNGDVQQESVACTKVALVEHERLLGEKQSEIVHLTTELGHKETEATARLDEKEDEIKALTTSLNVQVGEAERLREELQVFRNKNDELRKKNWKAMEAVENAEKSAVEKINSAVQNARDKCQSLDKSVLIRIFPDISVNESLEHDSWVKTFESAAVDYVKSLKEVSESSNELKKADTMAEELKTRLSDSEQKLSESEAKCNSLNGELQKLTEKLSKTDAEAESVENLHKQIETLKSQLKESTLKYTDLQTNSEETKTKLEDRLKELEFTFSETKTLCMSLKEQLENTSINNSTEDSEKQVETLTAQLTDLNEVVKKLESQVQKYQNLLKVTDDKLQVLQRSVEDEEMKWRREQQSLQKSLLEAQNGLELLKKSKADQNSTQSLEDVNSQTEKEEKYKLLVLQAEEDGKKVRDFSQTIVKLNGIIKTGQDALFQEQELVRQLKQQLEDNPRSISPTHQVQELRKKLAKKEKEVEQGQLYNNTLSQKLAQLGVMASCNDVGTSV